MVESDLYLLIRFTLYRQRIRSSSIVPIYLVDPADKSVLPVVFVQKETPDVAGCEFLSPRISTIRRTRILEYFELPPLYSIRLEMFAQCCALRWRNVSPLHIATRMFRLSGNACPTRYSDQQRIFTRNQKFVSLLAKTRSFEK